VSLFIGIMIVSEGNVDVEMLCQQEIQQGMYAQYEDAIGRCVEDMWKAEAGVAAVAIFAAILFVIGLPLFWLGWRIKTS